MAFSSIGEKLSSSFMGLFDGSRSDAKREDKVQAIREAMFACMVSHMGGDTRRHALWTQVRYADNVETLWYLRVQLMNLLSVNCDETTAAGELKRITSRFQGLLPRNQMQCGRKPDSCQ